MFGWWKRYRKRPRRPLLELYALEDRVLLDGTAFDSDALLATDLETIDIHSLVLVDGSESTPTAEGDASALPDALPDTSADQQSEQPLFADNAPSMRFEVIVLDTDLVDSDGIVRRIQEASAPNTSFVVYQLSPNNDGIHQLSAFLQGVSDVNSLHLVANQTDSVIRIGPTHLNAASLAGYAGDIAVWQSALTTDAELRFHGLAGASDEATFDLVESFSALLGHAVSVEGLDTQEFEQSDTTSPPNEIVVLTSDLPDVGALVQAWQAGAGDDQHFTYLVLESTADGVEGITRFLADSVAPYSAIHIVSHGFEGGIQLGSTVLATATLDGYHNQLTSWQSSLTEDADILIYGCDVAAGEAGETFIEQLAVWTGADIAASDDKTGNTELGGDWVLETQVGVIEYPFLLNERGMGAWYGLLNIAPEDIGVGTQFVGDSSTVISEVRTMPALDDFTLEITATPRSAINLPTPSNSGIIFPQTGGMAVLPEDGDSTYGTSGGVTRGIGIDIGTNGLVVYQHTSNLFSSLLTYSGSIAPDTDIAIVFTNKTPSLYLNGVLTVVGIQSDAVSLHPTVGSNASLGLGGGNTSDGGKYFTGTLSDYRIWDSALDEATINANRMMAIAPDAPGLLANMVPSSLAENSANGTLVATALGYDPDTGETFTYQLLDDAGGRFAIDSANGQITVADGSLLNYEDTTEHTIQIRVTDSQGATYDELFTVALLDQPDAPIAQSDSFTLISGVPIVIDPLANDSSSLGLPLAVTHIIDVADNNNLLALPSVGSSATLSSGTLITLRSDGRLDVTAAVDGQESFGYRLSDGDQIDDEIVTLTVASDETTAQSIGLVTTWDTRKPGSASNTIVLPAAPGSSNYTIYWGDGTKTVGASGSQSHTYTTAGIKTITIVGDFAGFEFNNGGDRQKILTVEKWGNIAYTDLNNAFRGAVNLQVKATDTPDLSNVTSLERLFEGISNISSNITGWDVSTITNMSYMFLNARTFNQNIGDWDVSHVTSMAGMFQGAWAFNQDISQWDTSNVTNMGAMFNDARGFNSDISGWDTSKVEHFGSMFFNADAFNRDIGSWDTSSATNMSNMFQEANAFNQDLLGWDVSKVTNMNYMFYRAWNFNGNISNWDTANVVSMVGMFNDAREFNQDLSQWNTEKVVSFREMFLNAYKFNGNITTWSTGKVIDFSRMFYSAIVFNQDISGWDTSAALNMSQMFYDARLFNQNIGNWNVSKVTNMIGTFNRALAFNGDISGWDVSAVTRMDSLFNSATSFNQSITNWNIGNVTHMPGMFAYAHTFSHDIAGWDVTGVVDMNSMFLGNQTFNQDISGWDVSNVVNMSRMFEGTSAFDQAIGNWDVSNATDMSAMFKSAVAFRSDITGWDTSKVVNMSQMFYGLPQFNQDISTWNVSNVTNMSGMFQGATQFNRDLGAWDVSKVTNFSSMFSTAVNSGLMAFTNGGSNSIANWNVASGTNFSGMFYRTTFNQPIGNWDVSNATGMWRMFYYNPVFNQDISNWMVAKVTDFTAMFESATAFNQDLSNWNTGAGKNFNSMFWGASKFNQSLGLWDVGSVTSMNGMLNSSGMSVVNYDATLNGWASQGVKSNVSLGASGLAYTSTGKGGRDILTGTYNWAISDSGEAFAPIANPDSAISVEAGGTFNTVVGTNPSGNVLNNDTDANSGDTKKIVGIAPGVVSDVSTPAGESLAGKYGAIVIQSTGGFQYTLDNNNTEVQALRTTGDTLSDIFTYMMVDSRGLTSTTQVIVSILGSNDNPSDIAGTFLNVDENAGNGASVGILTGADVDTFQNGETLTYSLLDSSGGRFAIQSTSGQITVANGSLLDRESANSHSITARVTDAAGAAFDKVLSVALNDVDEFDVGDVSDSDATANSLAENAGNGTAVGITALAFDADATNNVITYSLADSAGGRFAINSSTGMVTVANGALLNYEAATSHNVTVRATSSDGSFSTQAFSISLTDIDEFDVGPISDSNATANSVVENAANGTTVGVTASASDTDGTNNTISYSLADDDGGRFAINASTGVVTVAGAIDREVDGPVRLVTVIATSIDGSSSSRVFEINIRDLDEYDVTAPIDVDAAVNRINENAPIGTNTGIRLSAVDLDATNHSVSFSLDDSADGRFTIDPLTGVISVADSARLDYETTSAYTLLVRAHSEDGSSALSAFAIYLQDVGEVPIAVADYGVAIEAGGTENSSSSREAQGNVLDNDTDADLGDTKTIVGLALGVRLDATGLGIAVAHPSDFVVQGLYGTVSMSDDGGYVYTVDDSLEAVERLRFPANTLSEIFTYTFIDGSNQSATSQLEIIIRGSNDAPTGEDLQFTIYANEVLDSNGPSLLQNAFDIENANLTTLVGRTPSSGKVTVNPDGSIVYTPNAGFFGSDSFTYLISDGELTSNEHVVTIDVRAISMNGVTTKEASVQEGRTTSSVDLSPESSTEESGTDRATESLTHDILISVNQLTNSVADESLGDLQESAPLVNNSDRTLAFSFLSEPASEDQDATSSFPIDSISAKSLYQGEMNHSTVLRSIDFEAMMNDPSPVNDALRTIDWTAWAEESAISESTPLLPDLGVGIVGASAGAISVGYVYWALRGGALAASCIGGVSAWRMLDVSSVLENHHNRAISDSRTSVDNGLK